MLLLVLLLLVTVVKQRWILNVRYWLVAVVVLSVEGDEVSVLSVVVLLVFCFVSRDVVREGDAKRKTLTASATLTTNTL